MERNASYMYKYISTIFKREAMFKIAKQFEEWSKEESEHADEMVEYLLQRQVMPEFHQVALPKSVRLAKLGASYTEDNDRIETALEMVIKAEEGVYLSMGCS